MSDDVYAQAARVYCLSRFDYADTYSDDGVREQHIVDDTAATAGEPWLRAVVDTARAAEQGRILDALALQHTNLVRRAIGEPEIRELGPPSGGPPALCACTHYLTDHGSNGSRLGCRASGCSCFYPEAGVR